MEEVQTLAHLASHTLNDADRDAVVVVALDHRQKITAQHLEDHADVTAMRAYVVKAVHQLHSTAVRIQLAPGKITHKP